MRELPSTQGVKRCRAGKSAKAQDKGPRQLLSKLLLAFLDAGDMDFGRVPDDASSAGRLIRLILQGMPSAETFCTASAGAIGLCQVYGHASHFCRHARYTVLFLFETCQQL